MKKKKKDLQNRDKVFLASPLAETEKDIKGKATWGYLVSRAWGLVDIISSTVSLLFQGKNIPPKVFKESHGTAKSKQGAKAPFPLHF